VFFQLFKTDESAADLYIDLGTANTLISGRKKGILLNEPSLVAYSQSSPGQKKILAVGDEAKEKLKANKGNLHSLKPIRDGVIADFDSSEMMLREFLRRPQIQKAFSRPRVVVSLPYGVTQVEKKSVYDACKSAGARDVFLVDEPMVAAIGSGIPVKSAQGHMIIDIGGGTTEVAVIALADIVYCEALRMGGHKMDDLVISFMKKQKNLVINEVQAENLKIQLGSAVPKKEIVSQEVAGRDLDSGLPRSVTVTSEDIGMALNDGIEEIINAIHKAIEHTPPELVSDIIDSGITITGGGALIRHMDLRIKNEVRLNVQVAPDPLTAIAKGGEALLSDPDLLEKVQLEI
jgi:rod shape-determining protein MreB and related proteins